MTSPIAVLPATPRCHPERPDSYPDAKDLNVNFKHDLSASTAAQPNLLESTGPPPRNLETMGSNGAATQTEKEFYRIGDVSEIAALKPFVLRYWETEFPMLQPIKSPSGHRLYRQEDVDLILKIKRLLYDEGFTIAGARRHLRDGGGNTDPEASVHIPPGHGATQLLNRKMLLDLRDSLRAFLTLLERR
jgi:DNA-binding transcriptional MerR regulator